MKTVWRGDEVEGWGGKRGLESINKTLGAEVDRS